MLEAKAGEMRGAAIVGNHAAIMRVIADENAYYAQMAAALSVVGKAEEKRIGDAQAGVLATARFAAMTTLAITIGSCWPRSASRWRRSASSTARSWPSRAACARWPRATPT